MRYRLACERDPRPLDGFTEERDGVMRIRTAPEDLRKPCLENLMRRLAARRDVTVAQFAQAVGAIYYALI